MSLTISDLVAVTTVDSTDLFHLRKATNLDRKITAANLYIDIKNSITLALLATLKGFMQIDLTNWDALTIPEIVAGSVVEINGAIYTNPSAVAITGSVSVSTWYDILLTPSGTTFTASFVARGTGVWNAAKQGLYSGNNRVVACLFIDASNNYINKNVLIVNNRNVKVTMVIGDWNMDSTLYIPLAHGISDSQKIRAITAQIRTDVGGAYDGGVFDIADGGPFAGTLNGQVYVYPTDPTKIVVRRELSQGYDNINFDATSFNRGWVTFEYRV